MKRKRRSSKKRAEGKRVNKSILIGRLTNDANLSYVGEKQTAKATFNIAVNDGYGENAKAYYIPIVVWGKSAESVANYTRKGSKVGIAGKIVTRSYDDSQGIKKYITEVVADPVNGVEFLENKNSSSNENTKLNADITPVDNGDMPF
nr:single-stranded DNA-binding protein [Clostridium beijerinckii]